MIVVGDVMAVAMHGPKHVFHKAVRMAVVGNHLDVIDYGLNDFWRVV